MTEEAKAGASPEFQAISFTIGDEEYACDIMAIREIRGWSRTTSLPNAAPYMRGVINLRGIIVPIFDLRARFGMGVCEPTKTHVVIIVNVGNKVMGVLVDTVSDIISVRHDAIAPVPEMGLTIDERYLDGIVTVG
ncbi:MAG: chemotaxis protein CheW, partial [Rhodospirillales bacterium]|nr:chemotaxis protein CheW [Rhodospirillales bacterium]